MILQMWDRGAKELSWLAQLMRGRPTLADAAKQL